MGMPGRTGDHQWSQRHLSHYVEGELRPRARRRLDGASHARLAPLDLFGRHGLLRYFFLPSLRKMYSPAYFTPLPL